MLNDSVGTQCDKIKSHFASVQKNAIQQDLMCSVQKSNATKMLSPSNCAFYETIRIAHFERLWFVKNKNNLCGLTHVMKEQSSNFHVRVSD